MNYFCLIFPDAVHNGKATQIVEKLLQAQVKIVDRSIRRLSYEEAKVIFYTRRLDQDFETFCKILTASNVWLLNIEASALEEKIAKVFTEEMLGDFFIPNDSSDNEAFLILVTSSSDSKSKLSSVIQNVRTRLSEKEIQTQLDFSASSVAHGQKMFSYFTAMQIAGFTEEQAFHLTAIAQPLFLTGTVQIASEGEEDNDNEEDESDEDGNN